MGWDPHIVPDPQDPETFLRSKLRWDEVSEGDHARLLALYQGLARLRRERPELTDPAFASLSGEAVDVDGGRVYRLHRGDLLVLVNLGDEPVRFEGTDEILLATDAATAVVEGSLVLPRDSAAVVVTSADAQPPSVDAEE
jgi:maltooligosyltrehalose trehalohydrolase